MSNLVEVKYNTAFEGKTNYRQIDFTKVFWKRCNNKSVVNRLFFGGAIRGGKTAVCTMNTILFCLCYANARACIVRGNYNTLKKTVLESFDAFAPTHLIKKASNESGNMFREFKNGSKVIFMAESYHQDPEHKRFLGLETNLMYLEQMEEIQESMYEMAIQRAGSWRHIRPMGKVPAGWKMPPPLVIGNFNPAHNWLKEKIYTPFVDGTLDKSIEFIPATSNDSPYITEAMRESWKSLDPIKYQQYVDGDWNVTDKKGLFSYEFDRQKHVRVCPIDPTQPLTLSLDFNYSPATCTVWQHSLGNETPKYARCVGEIRVENTNVYEMCDVILKRYPGYLFRLTGDAAGNAHSFWSTGNATIYETIHQILGHRILLDYVPRSNPSIRDTKLLLNSILCKFDFTIDSSCEYTIQDLEKVKSTMDGKIDKKDKAIGHLLDTVRYFFWSFFNDFVPENLYELNDFVE